MLRIKGRTLYICVSIPKESERKRGVRARRQIIHILLVASFPIIALYWDLDDLTQEVGFSCQNNT